MKTFQNFKDEVFQEEGYVSYQAFIDAPVSGLIRRPEHDRWEWHSAQLDEAARRYVKEYATEACIEQRIICANNATAAMGDLGSDGHNDPMVERESILCCPLSNLVIDLIKASDDAGNKNT